MNTNAQLTQMIQQMGLNHRVIVAGLQTNPFNWIKHAALTVLCSRHEGFARVIVESLMCDVAVVSTDCPSGPNEILTGDLAQWLVPVDDLNGFAKTMERALKSSIDIDQNKLDKFDIAQNFNQYLDLIKPSNTIAASLR